ncbi:MAG: InlB B-repeat-containing protein, partial [Acholeplasmataceae bacterium]
MQRMKRLFLLLLLTTFAFAISLQTVFADETDDTATITYVVSEETLDGLESMDPPDPVTGIAGRQVNHIPTLSSSVYTFLGWYYYEDGEKVQHEKYDVIDEDLTLYGSWRLTPRVVRYELDGGENSPDNPQIVYGNETYELGDASKEGYDFVGWDLDGSTVTSLENVTSSLTLTAQFEAIDVVLNLDPNNGEDPYEETVTYDESYAIEEPTRQGYDFDGWQDEDNNSFPASGTVDFTEARTLTAQWTPRDDTSYEVVTYTEQLDGSYDSETEQFQGTTASTVDLDPKDITGFVLNDDSSVLSGEIAADGSLVLSVYYDRESYTVTFRDEDDDVIESQEILFEGSADAPDYSVPGYTVSFDESLYQNVTADVDVPAILDANTYEITFDVDGIDPIDVTFDQAIGTLPTPEAPTDEVFNGWKDADGKFYDQDSIYDVVGDLELFADFIPESDVAYTIEYRFENEAGDFVVDEDETRTLTDTAGEEVTAPELADIPAGFQRVGDLPSGIVTTAGDGLVLVVDYERITLTVTFSYYDNDALTETDVDVKYGLDVVAPTLDERTGYDFDEWDRSLSDITESQTITALYDPITYSITYNYGDEDSFDDPAVHDSPVESYTIESEEIELTDPTRNTYTFDGWYDAETGGSLVTTIPSGSTGDVELYAQWSVITYTVTFENDSETISEVDVEISSTVAEEDFPAVTAPDGQALLYWYYGDEEEFTSDTIVNSDLTLNPLFADAVEITFLDENGETIESDMVIIDMPIEAPELPTEDGYTYAWDQDVPEVASTDLTIQAVKTANTYTITFDSQGGSAVDPRNFDFGEATSAPDDPTRDGYEFDGWFEDSEATIPYSFTTMPAEDLTLYAGWTEEETSGPEVVVYSTGFESEEGFVSSTYYKNDDVKYEGEDGKKWGFFHGTPSTTSPMSGEQSAQMRWYASAPDNLGYIFTDFDSANIHRVEFLAKSTNSIELTVSLSVDGGSTWVADEDYDLSQESNVYDVPSEYQDDDIRLRFMINYADTPGGTSRLYIDDVQFYSYASEGQIESLIEDELEQPAETTADLDLPSTVTLGEDTYDVSWSSDDPAISD